MAKKFSAFTLVELIIVVVIIGILASIALTRYGPVVENARRAEAYSVLNEIVSAEKRYYLENSSYTTTISALDSFSSTPASDNFTFSVIGTSSSAYAQAARTGSTGGRRSYGMCLESGKIALPCDLATCNPTCP